MRNHIAGIIIVVLAALGGCSRDLDVERVPNASGQGGAHAATAGTSSLVGGRAGSTASGVAGYLGGGAGAVSTTQATDPTSGCRAPNEPGCSECCRQQASTTTGALECVHYGSMAGGPGFYVPSRREGGTCASSCAPCAQCTLHDEEQLRALVKPTNCDCSTTYIGIDPCFGPDSCECYCQSYLSGIRLCPQLAQSDLAQAGSGGQSQTATAGGGGAGGATSQSSAGAGTAGQLLSGAGGGSSVRYCRKTFDPTDPVQRMGLSFCTVDFCSALNTAVTLSDRASIPFGGAEVRAGRCAVAADSFDAVYVVTGVGATNCYYRNGAFVGMVTWGDAPVNVVGCPYDAWVLVSGEFPDAALTSYPTTCPGLTTYRSMRFAGSAGAAGAANAPEVGTCFQAATATCSSC